MSYSAIVNLTLAKIDKALPAGFFGRFSATVTNSSWGNLEFFKNNP